MNGLFKPCVISIAVLMGCSNDSQYTDAINRQVINIISPPLKVEVDQQQIFVADLTKSTMTREFPLNIPHKPAKPLEEDIVSRFPDRSHFNSKKIDPIIHGSGGRIRAISVMKDIESLKGSSIVQACNNVQSRTLEAIPPGQNRCENCHNTDTSEHQTFIDRMRDIQSRVPSNARLDHTNIQNILEMIPSQEGAGRFLVLMKRGDLYLYSNHKGALVCEARQENGNIMRFIENDELSVEEMTIALRRHLDEQPISTLTGDHIEGLVLTGSPNHAQRRAMQRNLQ